MHPLIPAWCPSCIWLLISRSGVFPAAPGVLGSNKLLPCCDLARNINWRVCCEDTVCFSTPHITCHKITDTVKKLFSKLRTGGLRKEILKSYVSKTLTFCNILYQKSGKHKFYFQGIKPSFSFAKETLVSNGWLLEEGGQVEERELWERPFQSLFPTVAGTSTDPQQSVRWL